MAHTPASSRSNATGENTTTLTIRYHPLAEIGAGGMGTVALARAVTGPRAGTHVAVKRLYPHLEGDPEIVKAFLDEVWLISSLHHRNVVEPYDWGRDDQGSYLAMEFVPGDSLRALVRARESAQDPLPIGTAVEIVACAAAGLHAAHELRNDKGVPLELVHRDVSPANVLVGYEGSVKLIDFGVAKAVGKMVSTQHGLIKGKYGYMSPEQMRGEKLDRRSDIFSLGVLAWELLTLCRLYNAASEFESFRMIADEEPVPPSDLRHDVPSELDRIILRCLAKTATARYATCADLLRELGPFRLPAAEARHAVAAAARESMPERLHWVEQVTGRPVERIESALGAPSRAGEDHPAGERTEREVPTVGDPTPVPRVPVAPPPVALPPAGPVPVSDDADTVPESNVRSAVPAAMRPLVAPPPSLDQRLAKQLAPHIARARRRLAPLVARARTPEGRRILVLVGALVAIAVAASLVGAWLGSR